MVLQIPSWKQKISSKVMAISHYTPDMFVKSQWQTSPGISVYYLVYRWAMASVFFSILIASLMDLGRAGGDFVHYAKWLIYLTHWGLFVCTIQALIAAYLVTMARCKRPEKEAEAMKMNFILQIYWVSHTIATVGAFCVTTIYWAAVYDPAIHRLDSVNILVHAGNSVLMLIELVVIAHPIRLIDCYWPVVFAIIYIIFNFLYFLAGGTDRHGRTYIYKILDWQKPLKSLVTAQFSILFLLFIHTTVSLFCLLKHKIYQAIKRKKAERREERAKNMQGATNEIPINDLV